MTTSIRIRSGNSLLRLGNSLFATLGGNDLITVAGQQRLQDMTFGRRIVNDEDLLDGHGLSVPQLPVSKSGAPQADAGAKAATVCSRLSLVKGFVR
jgi:hypothetical protein